MGGILDPTSNIILDELKVFINIHINIIISPIIIYLNIYFSIYCMKSDTIQVDNVFLCSDKNAKSPQTFIINDTETNSR